MYACMYIYEHLCMNVCMYVYMYTYMKNLWTTRIYIMHTLRLLESRKRIYTVFMYVRMYVYEHVCMYV